jgi:type II secretory pathway component HofQ
MRKSLSFLLVLALALATGCARKKTTTKEPEGAAAEAAAPAETPAETPAEERATPPSMEDLEATDAVERERRQKLSESLRAMAERARANGDLGAAREAYRKILQLDPSDQLALDAFNRLSVELGDRGAVAAEVLEGAGALEQARREQAKREISMRLARAREAEDEGNHGAAIRYYEEILNILEWYPYQAEFPVTSDKVREMLDTARQRKRLLDERQARQAAERAAREEREAAERSRDEEMRRMRIYMKQADDAFARGDYANAEAQARKVLAIDPRNEAAAELVRVAKESMYTSTRAELREAFSDEWRLAMERLEWAALPQVEVIRFPETWDEIAQRRPPRTGSTSDVATDPRSERILNVLETKRVYELSFKAGEITLDGVRSYLASVTGENFVLSQKVKEEKADAAIELQVTDVTVRQVLDLITEEQGMAWKIRNGVVMLLAADEAAEKPVLQFYDVKDLVAKISDFPGQEINLVPSKYQPPEAEEDREPVAAFDVEQLIDAIKNTIEPTSWEAEGHGIDPKNNVLVVRTSPEIHRKVAQLLHDLRRNTGLLVSMEVRFLTAEDRFLRDIGVDVRGLGDQTGGVGLPGLGAGTNFDDSFTGSTANPSGAPAGSIPEPSSIGTARNPGIFYGDGEDGEYKGRIENLFDFVLGFDEPGRATATAQGGNVGANSGGFTLQHTFLDDTQFEVILRAVEKSERIELINAPRLTVYDTQRANVSVLRQNSYVQDFDVEIAQAAAIGDPIIQTIRDGIILDVRPIVSADRRFITMELRPTVADLVRPIPTFTTTLATGPPVTIQVPEISISRVRTTVTMPDGGVLLLGGIKFFRDIVAESGLPIVNKIPVLSFLFGRKAKSIQRRNLLILIRAEVQVHEEKAPVLAGAR